MVIDHRRRSECCRRASGKHGACKPAGERAEGGRGGRAPRRGGRGTGACVEGGRARSCAAAAELNPRSRSVVGDATSRDNVRGVQYRADARRRLCDQHPGPPAVVRASNVLPAATAGGGHERAARVATGSELVHAYKLGRRRWTSPKGKKLVEAYDAQCGVASDMGRSRRAQLAACWALLRDGPVEPLRAKNASMYTQKVAYMEKYLTMYGEVPRKCVRNVWLND